MIRYALIFSAAVLSACGTTPGGVYPGYQPAPAWPATYIKACFF